MTARGGTGRNKPPVNYKRPPSRPGYGQKNAELKERTRKIRAIEVRKMQEHAKQRMRRTPALEPLPPPPGTIGWVRSQTQTLIALLGQEAIDPATALVGVIMANATNELGETRIGQRRIHEIFPKLSMRKITDAWAELTRIGFFEATVAVPDHYRPERRAGTLHRLRMPREEQLSLPYQPLALEPERQTSLAFEPDQDAPAVDVPAPRERIPTAPHVGGVDCPCRPCRAAQAAAAVPSDDCPELTYGVEFEPTNPAEMSVAKSAGEASQTETLSVTEGTTLDDAFTSRSAMLTRPDAPDGAIDAAHDPDPIVNTPTRGVRTNGKLARPELALARQFNRQIATRRHETHAPRREPAQIEIALAPSLTSRSIVTDENGQRRFDAAAFLSRHPLTAADSNRTYEAEQTPDQPTLDRTRSQSTFGHPEHCGCIRCEAREATDARDDRERFR